MKYYYDEDREILYSESDLHNIYELCQSNGDIDASETYEDFLAENTDYNGSLREVYPMDIYMPYGSARADDLIDWCDDKEYVVYCDDCSKYKCRITVLLRNKSEYDYINQIREQALKGELYDDLPLF